MPQASGAMIVPYKSFVFDTETSDMLKFALPADDPSQVARLASLAIIALDEELKEEWIAHRYVKPNGWTMSPGATKANKITTEFLERKGFHVREVLPFYQLAIGERRVAVSFNTQFDLKIMRGELRRVGISDLFQETLSICLMRAMTDQMKMPRLTGGFKWPKLAEAYHYLFNEDFHGKHHAMGDTIAAVRIFRECVKRGILPQPQLYPR